MLHEIAKTDPDESCFEQNKSELYNKSANEIATKNVEAKKAETNINITIVNETSTRGASSTRINLLPPNAPPLFESPDSVFKDLLKESIVTSTEPQLSPISRSPPTYQDAITVAQNQVTLVHDNPERTVIVQIDTESHAIIRQIRDYLRQRLNVDHVHLTYRDRVLVDDDATLADYGWTSGKCGTITVRTSS